jgi:hypothetical protein
MHSLFTLSQQVSSGGKMFPTIICGQRLDERPPQFSEAESALPEEASPDGLPPKRFVSVATASPDADSDNPAFMSRCQGTKRNMVWIGIL